MKDITESMSTKTTKKKTDTKDSKAAARAKLAKGAAELRKAEAAAKKAKPAGKRIADNTTKSKPVKVDSVEPPLKIVLSKDDLNDIMARCVKTRKDNTGLTLAPETTAGEYVALFDHFTDYAEKFQLLIGDLIIAGETLPAFGGDKGKYTAAMLASGRSLSTLKAYRSTALHTPPKLRTLPYTHLHATVKVQAIEDKTTLIEEATAEAKDGKMPSVKVLRERAAKFAPKKTGGKKRGPKKAAKAPRETRDLTFDENEILNEIEDVAAKLESLIGGASFLLEAKTDSTSTLREKLGAIARFHGQLAD